MTISEQPRVLVIGVGNRYRGDDAAGFIVAWHLEQVGLYRVAILGAGGEGATLMEWWKDAEVVILIDAAHSGAAPGTLYRFDAHAQPIPAQFFRYSTQCLQCG